MKLTRDYAFDMIEMIGKAISTARKKAAGPEWDLDEQLEILIRRWQLDRDALERRIREEAENEDNRWNLDFGEWRDSSDDGTQGPIDERENRKEYSKYGSEAFEQRKAKRYKDHYGDWVSCRLWEIQRRLRFKIVGVQDTLKDLAEFCRSLPSGYISAAWGNRLMAIIDTHSRG